MTVSLIHFFFLNLQTGIFAREYFRSTLPSAYNTWSPWAWDWWLNKEQQDVTKTEKPAREETSKAADKNQRTVQQSTPKIWAIVHFTAWRDTLILPRVHYAFPEGKIKRTTTSLLKYLVYSLLLLIAGRNKILPTHYRDKKVQDSRDLCHDFH